VLYVGLAVGFGIWFTFAYGGDFGTQYFAGYLVEKSLSVDNLFVFVVIMRAHIDLNPRVPEIPTLVSLAVIVVVLVIVTVASLIRTARDSSAKAHAGSLRTTSIRHENTAPHGIEQINGVGHRTLVPAATDDQFATATTEKPVQTF
jgi:tellurite resistance protein TerC